MKKKIGFIALFMVFCIGLIFTGCNETTKKYSLDIPQNLTVENDVICFDEVENASYYSIYIDGTTFSLNPSNTGEIIYDASKLFTQTKDYEIKVRALGTGKFKNSAYTNSFIYSSHQAFDTPNIVINDKIISWQSIPGAKNYTIRVNYPNNTKGYYTYSANSFDIHAILNAPGEYSFAVKAGEKNEDSDFSNEISYKLIKKLSAPSNLECFYDEVQSELFLTFVRDVNSNQFLFNVNGVNYLMSESIFNSMSLATSYVNVAKIKMSSFLTNQGLQFNPDDEYQISVQSKSNNIQMFLDSDVSEKIVYSQNKTLDTPTLKLENQNNLWNLSWNEMSLATSYAIYKNGEFYTSVSSNVKNIILDDTITLNNVFQVQAQSLNFNSSLLSNIVKKDNLSNVPINQLSYSNGKLVWNSVEASKLILEIYNKNEYMMVIPNSTENEYVLDTINFGNYNARLTIYQEDCMPRVLNIQFNHTIKLSNITNAQIGDTNTMYTLNFDKVDNAFGYEVMLNNQLISHLFTTNIIKLENYVSDQGEYSVKVRAIAYPNSNMTDGNWLTVGTIKHHKILEMPVIIIEQINDKYYLKFDEIDNAINYDILINYIKISSTGLDYQERYDITPYLTSAQTYTIMVKANASLSDRYYSDSSYASVNLSVYKQLITVNEQDMLLEYNETKGEYLLNFQKQTHAASYNLRIVNLDKNTEIIRNISTLPYNLTNLLLDSGVYNIYVMAIASNQDGTLYLNSAESGNPYVFEKDKASLLAVENINFENRNEDNSNFFVSWAIVNNAESYMVEISYTPQHLNNAVTTIIDTVNVPANSIDLNNYVSKEGKYTVKVKAISKNYQSVPYQQADTIYTMTVKDDYKRNLVHINGINYSHYVTNYNQFKNLIWYYYLYNDNKYYSADTSSNYRLKIRLGTTINELLADYGGEIIGDNNQQKLKNLASIALASYPDNVYVKNNFIYHEEVTIDQKTYYLFDYENVFANDKTELMTVPQDELAFNGYVKTLNGIDRRKENYIFALDTQKQLEVSNSEQLFMAVQSNRSPKFVGESEVSETIYNNAKTILREIINDRMNEVEKVEAIYSWLTNKVRYYYTYEDEVTAKGGIHVKRDGIASTNNVLFGDCKYDYLEGVFYSLDNCSASSNGFAKAFVLLCRLEGIEAIKVMGTKDNKLHYWNKVYFDTTPEDSVINREWLSVDIPSSFDIKTGPNNVKYLLPSHKYAFVTDKVLKARLKLEDVFKINENANSNIDSSFDIYNHINYSYNYTYNALTPSGIQEQTIQGNGSFKYIESVASCEDFIIDVLKYLAIISNNENNCSAEIDLINYNGDINAFVSAVKNNYYNQVSKITGTFKVGAYANIEVDDNLNIISKLLTIVVVPND